MRRNLAPRAGLLGVFGLPIVALVLALLGVTAVAATTLPGCQGCHFKKPGFRAGTLSSVHGRTACADCHVSKRNAIDRGKFGVYEVFGMWVPILDPSATDATLARDSACLACHGRVLKTVSESNGLRVKHSSFAAERRCVDCHSSVAHGSATSWPRTATMSDCVTCHRKEGASLQCSTCHVGKLERSGFLKPEFTVTHGPNWKTTHGMGQMSSCSTCHNAGSCARCHGAGVPHASGFITQHDSISKQPDAKCEMCHQKKFCSDCHGIEMPHPKTFASMHSGIVRESGRERCARCHANSDCEGCHLKHVHPGGAVGNLPGRPKAGGR